jgi:NitT/TauT family transport system substrate-binding protein
VRFLALIFFFSTSLNAIAAEMKIRVGSSPVLSSAGIYLAEAKGYFKDQGLNVEITDVANSGAPMTLLLAKGELEVGAGNLTSGLFTAIASGQGVKLVADKGHAEKNRDYIALIVRRDHVDSGRYKSLKDLKGFKVGLTALDGVSQQIVMDKFLRRAGLTEKDVEYVKLSYAEMNAALKTKSLDATIQLEPFVARAELGGFAARIAGSTEVHPEQQSAALMYSPSFMKNRREEATKFMAAYLKGVRLYNKSLKDPAAKKEVRAILGPRLKITDEKLWDKIVPVGLRDSGDLNVKSLQEDLDWYAAKGYLKTKVGVASIYDPSFAQQAQKMPDAK